MGGCCVAFHRCMCYLNMFAYVVALSLWSYSKDYYDPKAQLGRRICRALFWLGATVLPAVLASLVAWCVSHYFGERWKHDTPLHWPEPSGPCCMRHRPRCFVPIFASFDLAFTFAQIYNYHGHLEVSIPDFTHKWLLMSPTAIVWI